MQKNRDELGRMTIKKRKGKILADIYHRQGDDKRAARVAACGTQLTFAEMVDDHKKKLVHGNFCRDRLCPVCAWLRSRKIFAQVSQVMDAIQRERPELVPVFLTLTVKNCKGEDLTETLDSIFGGWKRVLNNDRIKRIVPGWFRALEITYDEVKDTYHPHIHAILLVGPDYFKRKSRDYMTTRDWVKLWRKAMRLDYNPVCDIRKVRPGEKGAASAVAEVAKYTVKDTDYLKEDQPELTDKLVATFGTAIRGRRLVAFGGLMMSCARQLKLGKIDDPAPDQPEQKEIRDENGRVLRMDIDYILVRYRWSIGLSKYLPENRAHEKGGGYDDRKGAERYEDGNAV